MDAKDVKELWEKLATAYRTKPQLNIRKNLFDLRIEDCENVDSHVSKKDEKFQRITVVRIRREPRRPGG